MPRLLLISLMVLSVVLGSLGLPVYLHSCRMMGEEVASASCGMCRHDDEPAAADESSAGMEIEAPPCCSTHQIVQRTAPTTMPQIGFEPVVPVVTLAELLTAEEIASRALEAHVPVDPSPPPLASRAQSSYLINSSFLI